MLIEIINVLFSKGCISLTVKKSYAWYVLQNIYIYIYVDDRYRFH